MKEIDITKNELVPKHEILNDTEKHQVLAQYKITLRQLPRINSTDPVIQNIGGKVGDVIKITRKSPVAGDSVYYRVIAK